MPQGKTGCAGSASCVPAATRKESAVGMSVYGEIVRGYVSNSPEAAVGEWSLADMVIIAARQSQPSRFKVLLAGYVWPCAGRNRRCSAGNLP